MGVAQCSLQWLGIGHCIVTDTGRNRGVVALYLRCNSGSYSML